MSNNLAFWKKAVIAAAALALAGSTLVYAQHRPGHAGHWRPTAEDLSALTDARVAGLKAGLRLNAEQEKNWPAFEQAVRDFAKLRAERREAWLLRERTWYDRDRSDRSDRPDASGEPRAESPIDRLQRRADVLSRRAAAVKALADAAAPLYQSLDDAQKRRFVFLARTIGPRHQRFAFSPDHRGQGRPEGMDRQGGDQR